MAVAPWQQLKRGCARYRTALERELANVVANVEHHEQVRRRPGATHLHRGGSHAGARQSASCRIGSGTYAGSSLIAWITSRMVPPG